MVSHLFSTSRRLLAFTLTFLLLTTAPGWATEFSAVMLTDGPRAGGYIPQNIRLIDGVIYFSGIDADNGLEPRVTANAPTGALLLGDLFPGGSSSPDEFTKAGSLIYFSARDNVNGRELWATDGTPQNTRLVKDIANGPIGSSPADFIECQGKILFTADDSIHGRELWVSDGTSNGTTLVKDINQNGKAGANIAHLFNWNGIVYFAAEDGTNNEEVWRTDGTPNGTYLLKDLNDHSADPSGFAVYKNELYFQANASAYNGVAQLWKTDGTSGGTVLIKNIPGATSGVEQLTVVGNQLFFAAPTVNHEFEVWRSDGTTVGTALVKDIDPNSGSDPESLVSYQGALYFVASDGTSNGRQVWKTDGTDANTVMVHPTFNPVNQSSALPDNLVVVGGALFFQQNTGSQGRRWVQSDGSSAAFDLVSADAVTAMDDPTSFLVVGSSLVFTGRSSASGTELFTYTPKLTITSSPVSRLVATGGSASFTVTTSFTGGVTYQWQHDSHDVPGANAATYTINSAVLGDGGRYHAVVSNGAAPQTSDDATLGVVERTVADATAPEAGKLVFKVNTTGAGLTYQWKHAGTNVMAAARFTGINGATLQISGVTADDVGAYTCDVTLGNETITTLAAAATIITKPVVTDTAPPPSIVSGAYHWQLAASQSPTSFAVTGLPLGLRFEGTTGVVSGTPRALGQFTVKVTARNAAGASATQSFTLNIGSLPDGVAGTFTGVIGREVNLNGQLGGSTRLTVTKTGVVTGQAVFGALAYTVRGFLDAPLQGNPTAALVATHAGKPSVTLSLTFDGPDLMVSGTASNALGSASIDARLLVWSASNPAVALAGNYNASLALPQNLAGSTAYPQGAGWLQLKVAKSGVVTVSGQVADGAPVTLSTTTLWPNGQFPLLKVLYSGHGSLLGTGQIAAGGVPGNTANRVTGTGLQWQKVAAAGASDHTYAAGFPNVALTSDGSIWIPPHGTNVLALTDAPDNAQIAFSGAGIESVGQHQSVDQTFTLTTASVAKFTAVRNPCGDKTTFFPATGRFTGSLVLTDANPAGGVALKRTVSFSGVVLPHRGFATGHFLLPSLPAAQTTPTIQSGLVSIAAQQ